MARLLLSLGCMVTMALAAVNRYGAVPFTDNSLTPRLFLDNSSPLVKRQGSCPSGSHSCYDVRSEKCCPDTRYCYINDDDELKCCPLGKECKNVCGRQDFRCYGTKTISATRTASDDETPTPTIERELLCCSRQCPGDKQFKCPNGGCCGYGTTCGNNVCEKVLVAEPSRTGLVSAVPEGCSNVGDVPCNDGGGCCSSGNVCVQVSSQAMCSLAPPTDTSAATVDESSKGLGDGAKAGIAIGTVFGAGIIIAALTWLCIRRRRRRRTETQRSASGVGRPVQDNMTDLTASTRPPIHGMTQDYFGPDAVSGPYTEPIASTATSPNPDRGVPSQPQSPRDIHVPVEMDSRAQSPESVSTSYYATPMSYLVDGRHELHGASYERYDLSRPRSPSLQHTPPAMTPRDELP